MEAAGQSVCSTRCACRSVSCLPAPPAQAGPSTAFLAGPGEIPGRRACEQARSSFWNSTLAAGVTPGLVCDETGQGRVPPGWAGVTGGALATFGVGKTRRLGGGHGVRSSWPGSWLWVRVDLSPVFPGEGRQTRARGWGPGWGPGWEGSGWACVTNTLSDGLQWKGLGLSCRHPVLSVG